MTIEEREAHIIRLARVVAAVPGEALPNAPTLRFWTCGAKTNDADYECSGCGFGEVQPQGQASRPGHDEWWCPVCLPGEIEQGEVVIDRLSAHRKLAGMLRVGMGEAEYVNYFHAEDSFGFVPGCVIVPAEAYHPYPS